MSALTDRQTPFAVVDRERVAANARRLTDRLDALGVPLRLHVKTAKTIEVANLVFNGTPGPIAVSTLAEAEHFAAHGYADIVYAVSVAPDKLDRVLALLVRGVDLTVLLDSAKQAQAVAQASRGAGTPIPALLEIDCDGHRSGLAPDDSQLLGIARILHDGGAQLRGVLTHAGESYEATTPTALRAAADNERDSAIRAAGHLRGAGLPCPVVSVGSTPTALAATDLTGVTDVRAGNFVFLDRVMTNLGVCTADDIALSVVVTVIGHQPGKGWTITDGGWTATSPDHGPDGIYGLVATINGELLRGLAMIRANQEHGILAATDPTAQSPDLPVGTRLRILPHHACATANQHREYVVLNEPQADEWVPASGW